MEDSEERTSRLMKVSTETLTGNPQSEWSPRAQGEVLASDTSMALLLQVSLAPPCSGPRCGIPWLCLISRACVCSVFMYWSYCELQSLNPARAAKAQHYYSGPAYENSCSHVMNSTKNSYCVPVSNIEEEAEGNFPSHLKSRTKERDKLNSFSVWHLFLTGGNVFINIGCNFISAACSSPSFI